MNHDALIHNPTIKAQVTAGSVTAEGKVQVWGRDAAIFEQFSQPTDCEALIAAAARSDGDAERIARLISAWRGSGLLIAAKANPAVVDSSGSIRIGLNRSCGQLFVIFSGRGDNLFFSPQRFSLFTGIANRNVVMLRDITRQFYTAGVSRSLRSIEGVGAWLAGFCSAQPHIREVYCFGTSMGAFGAILHGLSMRAKAVFAFSPTRVVYNEVDLRALLERHQGKTSCRIYFSEGNERDARLAASFAGLPGVELYPQPGQDHLVLRSMDLAGDLARIVPAFRGAGTTVEAPLGLCERDIIHVIQHHLGERFGGDVGWDEDASLDELLDSFETVVLLSRLQSACGCNTEAYTAGQRALGSARDLARGLASMIVPSPASAVPAPQVAR